MGGNVMDNELSKLFDKIKKMCKEEANKIFVFCNNNTNAFNSELFELKHNKINAKCITNNNKEKKSGIYIFLVSADFTINCKKFDSVTYAAKTNDRLESNTFKQNNCFYLGKSENDILSLDKELKLMELEKNQKALIHKSMFYKILRENPKVEKVSIKATGPQEQLIFPEREVIDQDFPEYIIDSNELPDIYDENAMITRRFHFA